MCTCSCNMFALFLVDALLLVLEIPEALAGFFCLKVGFLIPILLFPTPLADPIDF